MNALAQIQSHRQTAGQHVGDLLWWSLDDARISATKLAQVWTSSGLSPKLLPEAPTPEKALKTACREQAVGRSDYLIRLGKEDGYELVFAVVREEKDASGNVRHAQEARRTRRDAAAEEAGGGLRAQHRHGARVRHGGGDRPSIRTVGYDAAFSPRPGTVSTRLLSLGRG